MMQGPAHHQGSRTLSKYMATWSSSHGGQPLGSLKGWALAHKGKATSSIDFNSDDGSESYSNPAVHNRISEYTSMAWEVHGPVWDPIIADIDGEVAMRMGGGKKHKRYYIGDSVIDTTATPSLSQIRARSTSSSPAISTRPSSTMSQLQALQAKLDEVTHQREEDGRRAEENQQQLINGWRRRWIQHLHQTCSHRSHRLRHLLLLLLLR
ncbi:hypothetical protein QOZ80_4BG0352430 [Eleusine coracana subsp. coracana]|nr:hypothetical protein QOZ80_4BG0352430 [Eleusine coracana subsp. coracana]